MLWDFFQDGIKVFLLRFFPLQHYRYHWTTLFGVLLFLGISTYLIFYIIIGIHPLIIGLCIFGQILRCIILNETASKVLLIQKNLKLNLFSFIVLTEGLSLILILFYIFLIEQRCCFFAVFGAKKLLELFRDSSWNIDVAL